MPTMIELLIKNLCNFNFLLKLKEWDGLGASAHLLA